MRRGGGLIAAPAASCDPAATRARDVAGPDAGKPRQPHDHHTGSVVASCLGVTKPQSRPPVRQAKPSSEAQFATFKEYGLRFDIAENFLDDFNHGLIETRRAFHVYPPLGLEITLHTQGECSLLRGISEGRPL